MTGSQATRQRLIALACIPLCLAGLVSTSHGQIYKQVQPDGSVVYTDKPTEGTESTEVELKPLMVLPATKIQKYGVGQPMDTKQSLDFKVAIASPTNGATFQNSAADEIKLVINVTPELFKPYTLKVSIDGKPVNSQANTLPYMNRGKHELRAEIVKANSVVESTSVIFYVHRQSVLHDQNRKLGSR